MYRRRRDTGGHERPIPLPSDILKPQGGIMSIPDFQTCMLPLLELASDGAEQKIAEAVQKLSDRFILTAEEREALLPSGTQYIIANRIGWARSHMKKAGLLTDPRRSHFQITNRGRELLATHPKSTPRTRLPKRPSSMGTKSSPRAFPTRSSRRSCPARRPSSSGSSSSSW
jgi:restriction endonuclease Mrr